MFVFVFWRKFVPLFAKIPVAYKFYVLAKVFAKIFSFVKFFAKIFHLECGSGFRSHLNVYPAPKHWVKIFAKTEIFSQEPSREQQFFSKT
jgi:hypothetical protein